MQTEELTRFVTQVLEDAKAQEVAILDVTKLSDVMDNLIICCGRSSRHVKAIAQQLVEQAKHNDHQPLGVEGLDVGEWVLIDLGDVVVHVMRPEIREFYQLEKLWSVSEAATG